MIPIPRGRAFFELAYGLGREPWTLDRPPRRVVELASTLAPARALDLGCGRGVTACWLASCGWEVTGVDISAVALASACELARERDLIVDWRHGDVRHLDRVIPDRRFEMLLDVGCYHNLPAASRRGYARAVARAAAPGARLLLSAFAARSWAKPHATPDAIVSDFCPPFALVAISERDARWCDTWYLLALRQPASAVYRRSYLSTMSEGL